MNENKVAIEICQFPCSCPNPNDCSHDDDCTSCDQPAVIFSDGLHMCKKHHSYNTMCLLREKSYWEKHGTDIKSIEFSSADERRYGAMQHSHDYEEEGPDPHCKACQILLREERRLGREHEAEEDAPCSEDDRTFYVDGKPVPTYGTED